MAMSGADLAALVKTKMDALRADPSFRDGTWTPEDVGNLFYLAFCEAIVEYFQTEAQIQFRPTDAGIQTSEAVGSPTSAPASTVVLPPGQIL